MAILDEEKPCSKCSSDGPSADLLQFAKHSSRIVRNAAYRSKKFTKLEQYDEIEDSLLRMMYRGANCDVYAYGSRTVGIGSNYSDLDIYLDIDNQFAKGNPNQFAREQLYWLAKRMSYNKKWKIELIIPAATVPVLRCVYIDKSLSCDIIFSDGLGVVNCDLLFHLFEIQPEAIKFFHCIRIWFSIMKINLRRYQLTLLVIFFLQSRGFMPSIARTQKNLKRTYVKDSAVSFNNKRSIQDYGCHGMDSFKRYIIRFFRFYSEFDFANLVVFPYLGRAVRRLDYKSEEPFLTRICNNLTGFKLEKPMAVASTLTIDYNVTWDVDKDRLQDFVDACKTSATLLENHPDYPR